MPKRNLTVLTKRLVEAAPLGSFIWDAQLPGLGVRVMPSGYRSFVFQYRTRSGTQGKVTLGHFPSMTVDEARKLARPLRTQVDGGGNPGSDRKETRRAPTVAAMIDYYTGEYATAQDLKEQTASEMRCLLDRFVRPAIGTRKIADVQTADIRRIHGRVKDEASRYRANKVLAGLSRMFNIAIQDGQRASNPCYGVKKYPEDKRHTYLGREEVLRLLAACDRYEDQGAANAIRMLLLTGARLREVLQATWEQLDLEKGTWVKPSHHTKTRLVHQVYLADAVVALLRQMRSERLSGTFLFPGRSLDTCRVDLKRPWANICRDADLPHYRIHDLRRTYASFMLSAGVELSAVGRALGHTQPSTTQRYASLLREVEKDAANRAVGKMGLLRVVRSA